MSLWVRQRGPLLFLYPLATLCCLGEIRENTDSHGRDNSQFLGWLWTIFNATPKFKEWLSLGDRLLDALYTDMEVIGWHSPREQPSSCHMTTVYIRVTPLCDSATLSSSCPCEQGNHWAPRTGINVETTLWASRLLREPELLIAFLQPQGQCVQSKAMYV